MKKIFLLLFLTVASYSATPNCCSTSQSYLPVGEPALQSPTNTAYVNNGDDLEARKLVYLTASPNTSYCSGQNLFIEDIRFIETATNTSYTTYTVQKWLSVASCGPKKTCPVGQTLNEDALLNPVCVCPAGQTMNANGTCVQDLPVCDSNQTLDTTVNPPVCKDNPPACSDPDMEYRYEDESCQCKNGYPPLFDFMTQTYECQKPKCSEYDGILPLYTQNASRAYCDTLKNDFLGFTSTYYATEGLSCCYSDTVKDDDDTCPTNYIVDKNGICQPIGNNEPDTNASTPPNPNNLPPTDGTPTTENPDGTHTGGTGETQEQTDQTGNCLPNYIWDNAKQKCLLFLPIDDSNYTFGNEGNITDLNGTDGNGTDALQAPEDGGAVQSYSPGEFDNIIDDKDFQAHNKKVTDKSTEVLTGFVDDYLHIKEISLPGMGGQTCACTDFELNLQMLGRTYTKTVEICSYMDYFLDALKYVLKFMVLVLLLSRLKEIF